MLHPFVSSPRHDAAEEHVGGASISVLLHACLIMTAILVSSLTPTGTSASSREIGLPSAEHLDFVKLAPATPATGMHIAAAVSRRRSRAPKLDLSHLPSLAPIALDKIADIVAPQIDFAQETAQWAAEQLASGPASNNVITDVLRKLYAPAPANPNAVYSPDVVEKIASPLPGNPTPFYPRQMLLAGIETSVRVQFVVDSTGRVDEHTVNFPQTAQRVFVDAIKWALHHSRYFPAEFAGRRVAQTVSQDFVFRIQR